jgi:hypothetical protein
MNRIALNNLVRYLAFGFALSVLSMSLWGQPHDWINRSLADSNLITAPNSGSLSNSMNRSWTYRNIVNVTNSGSTLTDFEVNISLTSANFNFALAKSDGSDVRITAADGVTLLPFWIESWNSVAQTGSIWVRMPSVPNGTSTLYLYYGNPGATSASDGSATFEFFDDFSGTTVNNTGYYHPIYAQHLRG